MKLHSGIHARTIVLLLTREFGLNALAVTMLEHLRNQAQLQAKCLHSLDTPGIYHC